jgi:hypothetical protein
MIPFGFFGEDFGDGVFCFDSENFGGGFDIR